MPKGFKCTQCGNVAPKKWFAGSLFPDGSLNIHGQCINDLCRGYATIKEVSIDEGEEIEQIDEGEFMSVQDAITLVAKEEQFERVVTGVDGLDRVLGGGIVPGSLTLFTGAPGAGKTTLLMQACQSLAASKRACAYVSGEEPVDQIAKRYAYLGKFGRSAQLAHIKNIDDIITRVDDMMPEVVVIDSIQTVEIDDEHETGTAYSVKRALSEFVAHAKSEKIAYLIIGHMTKGGVISGPKALEYLVDCAIHLDGKRVLHCLSKNRFASRGLMPPISHNFVMVDDQGLVDAPEPEEEDVIPLAVELVR